VRKITTLVTALAAILTIAPAALAQSMGTVSVPRFDCDSVTITGAGWEPTEATVEVGVIPARGDDPENLVAGPVQVFPDSQGNIPATVVSFDGTPADGDYAAVVMVDGIVRGRSADFMLSGCDAAPTTTRPMQPTQPTQPTTTVPRGALPVTGSSTLPLLATGLGLVALGAVLVRRTQAMRAG
jgi:hypothetical protein